jgi:hypothetical protein
LIVRIPVKCEKLPAYWRKLLAVVTDEDYCEDCGGYREMEVLCEKYPGGRHWRAVVECGVCGDGYNTLYDNDFVRKYVAATT